MSTIEEISAAAERHAFAVRQLQAQRARLFEIVRAFGEMGVFANGERMAAVGAAIPLTKSQFMQDIYALLFNRGKRGGYFVEFGACDGVLTSNTWLLEKEFGWTGILAEPSLHWQKDLQKNRSAKLDFRCVAAESGQRVTFTEVFADHTRSSTLPRGDGAQYNVETVSLVDLLRAHDAPREIDFLSIDVEGPEFSILNAFPFDQYRFNFLCVEHHGEEAESRIKGLLEGAGYKQVFPDASPYDGFYVPV